MENISIRSASTQAKMIGTIVSISGALIVVLYAGPPLITLSSPSISPNQAMIGSPQSGWVLGGFLLAVDYSLVAVWYIFQVIPNVFLLLLWYLGEYFSSKKYASFPFVTSFSCTGFAECLRIWVSKRKQIRCCWIYLWTRKTHFDEQDQSLFFFYNSSRVSVICKIMSMSLSNTNWRVIE